MTDADRVRRDARAAATAARAAGATAIPEAEAKRLLAGFGVPTPRGVTLARPADATEAALAGLSRPLVAKVLTREGAHKSDFGGVRLGLQSSADAARALEEIEAAAARAGIAPAGWLVEEQAEKGVELVLGGVFDPRFGPCMMLGLGGVFVEIFEDVAFRVCPIDEAEARRMLAEIRGGALLSGARGSAAADRDALVAALIAFGGPGGVMMALDGEAAEVDVNPLIAGPRGVVAADARIILAPEPQAAIPPAPPLDRAAVAEAFRPLFRPQSMAVLGASASGGSFGNEVIRHSLAFGYRGRITPIHPKAAEVEGLATAPSLAALPEPADFAYVAIGAEAAIEALDHGAGKTRFAQVMSSGFGEAADGVEREARLLAAARRGGFRLIGPNCLGVHSPRGGITFVGGADPTPGGIGVISQSGGLAVDVILRGHERGLQFSAVTTLGNSADVSPADLLEHHIADPDTQAIGLYLEDVREGRRFVQRLREHGAEKPVALLVGGRTEAGGRAAASHTGSLAADARLWDGIERATGAAIVDTLDEFLNLLLLMQFRAGGRGRPTRNVALFGNGGGTSVLAADAFARAGLATPTLPSPTLAKLEALGLPPGTGLANPVDTPAGTLRHREGAVAGEILDILAAEESLDAIVVHVNLPVFTTSTNQRVDVIGGLVREVMRVGRAPGAPRIALVLRSDGSEATDARRREDRRAALAAGVAVFDELVDAAKAFGGLAKWEERAG